MMLNRLRSAKSGFVGRRKNKNKTYFLAVGCIYLRELELVQKFFKCLVKKTTRLTILKYVDVLCQR